MTTYSNSDYLERLERKKPKKQAWPHYQPSPLDHCSIKELKEKIIRMTGTAFLMRGSRSQKQIRAEAGSHDLRRWL